MSWVAVGVAGAAAVGGIVSQMSANDRENAANNKAFQQYVAMKIPDPEQQRLALQRFRVEGKLTPQLEQAIKQAPSEFENIAIDQNQKASQNRALSSLEQVGNEGGLRLQDKAALQEAMLKGQVQDRGARQAIASQMAQRGQGGSGFDLQAQLEGQQAAGDRASQAGLSVAASAQDRALQALMGAGNLATQYRGQNFQEQSAKAQAQDAINRFNAQNLQGVQHANIGAQNRAQEMNLAQQQQTSNQNVGLSNQEQQYNKELAQRQFENQMQLANAKAGIYNQQGQTAQRQGQSQANMFGQLGQAGVGMVAANKSNKTAAPDSSWYSNSNPNPSGETFEEEYARKNRSGGYNFGG